MAARSTQATHWKQQVARIRVPRDDNFGVGTGVLISQQHLLTAWHVVARDGVFVDGSLVDLPDLAPPMTGLAATLAWRHDTEDIALLRLESQLQVQPLLQLAQLEPQQAVEGEIYGYARGSATAPDPEQRAASPFIARLHTPSLGKPLNIAPEHPADVWSGLSGAPVVHKGRILGVISARNAWKKFDRLLAASIAPLHADLVAQAGLEDHSATQWSALLEDILRRSDFVRKAIAEWLAVPTEALVEHLLCEDYTQLLTALAELHDQHLRDLNHDEARRHGHTFVRLALALVAARAAPAAPDGRGFRVIDNLSPSSAPLALARLAGLPVRLERPTSLRDRPPGRDRIPSPPDVGPGFQPAKAIERHLASENKLNNPTRAQLQKALKSLRDLARRREDAPVYYFEVDSAGPHEGEAVDELATLLADMPALTGFVRRADQDADYQLQVLPILTSMILRQAEFE